MGDGWWTPPPSRFTPGKNPRYQLCSKLGGPQGRYGHDCRRHSLLPPLGFEPRTAQTIASRCTEYGVPAPNLKLTIMRWGEVGVLLHLVWIPITRWGGGGWWRPPPNRFTPRKNTRYPVCSKLGGPQGRYGRACRRQSLLPPLGFEPRTVQTIASLYTDYGVPAPQFEVDRNEIWRGP